MAKKKNVKNKGNVKTYINKNFVPKQIPTEETLKPETIASTLITINPPVLLKVCRLCEAKDGPFLNIFDADRLTARKIEDLMPFGIAENDDLPHKICFRCSAKVEELYEFIQKCIKTQESLRKAIGKKGSLIIKANTRTIWEEKLNKSNISNDDICDALIKKAMEGIKDLPIQSQEQKEQSSSPSKEIKTNKISKDISKSIAEVVPKSEPKDNFKGDLKKNISKVDEDDLPLKCETELPKTVKSETSRNSKKSSKSKTPSVKFLNDSKQEVNEVKGTVEPKQEPEIINTSIRETRRTSSSTENTPNVPLQPKFDIMDHVSIIKVNGVGILFQCKLCNRNFLKKEVVMSHGCAKNAGGKIEAAKNPPPPEPPKVPTVKYITTRPESDLKKSIVLDDSPITVDDDDEDDMPLMKKKHKPKIGPASKVKKSSPVPTDTPQPLPIGTFLPFKRFGTLQSHQPLLPLQQLQPQQNASTDFNSFQVNIQYPNMPSLNSRFKLVPGPNNTFSLVEESQIPIQSESQTTPPPLPPLPLMPSDQKVIGKIKIGSKRPAQNDDKPPETSTSQPYPVGLFQTLPHNSSTLNAPLGTPEVPFQTPAMKKHSYTVVQTGNPSKLLISTKQQPPEKVPRKKSKKGQNEDASSKQPFSVTLEDAARPTDSSNFFTFINVDPLLQPSYVLPTNNIIQESQISTSTNVVKAPIKDADSKYTCNMCNEKFTREKKLLTHIQLHYNKMDEEDKSRASTKDEKKVVTKRGRGRPKNS